MKIGILGGTFDPPHNAHLEIAKRAIKQFDLDKVIFIPSGNPWQKKDATPFIHRYEMTKILIERSNKFEIPSTKRKKATKLKSSAPKYEKRMGIERIATPPENAWPPRLDNKFLRSTLTFINIEIYGFANPFIKCCAWLPIKIFIDF